jgi:serine/threonine protein phosphatase PrpC
MSAITPIPSIVQLPTASTKSTVKEPAPLAQVEKRIIEVVQETFEEMNYMPKAITKHIEQYVDIDFIDILREAGITFTYVPGCLPPKKESPSQREFRVRKAGRDDIYSRLLRKFNDAKHAFESENDKGFYFREAPLDFPVERRRIGDYEMAVSSIQGVRLTMEDRHLMHEFELVSDGVIIKVPVLSVFDGHGGSGAAEYFQAWLCYMLQVTLVEFNRDGLHEEGIWNALKLCCVRLSVAYRQTKKIDGTTAVFAIVLFGKLWVLNLGDSRAVLYNNGIFIQLSEDAKPDTPRFKKCIKDRGGRVEDGRVNARLATARAGGDAEFGFHVSARGEVTMLPLSFIEGSILLLGCDGNFDVTSTWEMLEAVHEHCQLPLEKLVASLVHSAEKSYSADNITLAAMRFPVQRTFKKEKLLCQ